LPEGTVNEILSAVANTAPGQRPTMPSAPRGDKPKLKNTKPPETFAELFEPFFKKNPQRGSASDKPDSKPANGSSRTRPKNNPQGKKKPN